MSEASSDQPRERSVLRGARVDAVYDEMPVGVLVLDGAGVVRTANRVACRLLESSREQLVGRHLAEGVLSCFAPDGSPLSAAQYPPLVALATGAPVENAVCGLRSPGSERIRWFSTSALPHYDDREPARVVEVVATFLDVTALRDQEERRRVLEAQIDDVRRHESLGRLAGGIAHDFNNLLQSILGWTTVLINESPHGAKGHRELLEIERASLRAASLTAKMLAYAGRVHLVQRRIDVRKVVREAVDLTCDPERGIHVEIAAPESPIMADADAETLRSAFVQVLQNAREAVSECAGSVRVDIVSMTCGRHDFEDAVAGHDAPPGPYVRVTVRDSGGGMSEDERHLACDPFFSTKLPGRGLGLASVLGFVRAHRGVLSVSSRLGEGTSVTIFLPEHVHANDVRRHHSLSPRRDLRRASSVLIVDDESSIRFFASRVLERAGLVVHTACDGREALEILRRHPHDIGAAVIDLTMHGIDGRELARRIVAEHGGVRLLLSSGYRIEETDEELRREGFEGFLSKPYRAEEIVERVSMLVAVPGT